MALEIPKQSYTGRIRTIAIGGEKGFKVGGETAYTGSTSSTQLSVQLAERWDNVTLYWSVRATPSGAWAPARRLIIIPVPQTLTFFPLVQGGG